MQSVVAPTLYFLDGVCAFAVANIPYNIKKGDVAIKKM